MALISLRQLLDHAAENGYGMPAFNVNNMEQVHSIMQAADETNSPASTNSLATSPIRRMFSIRSLSEKPRSPFNPCRTLSPSKT